MAIDTAAKRRGASGAGFHPLGPGVTPAAVNQRWRWASGWSYPAAFSESTDGPPLTATLCFRFEVSATGLSFRFVVGDTLGY